MRFEEEKILNKIFIKKLFNPQIIDLKKISNTIEL